MEYVFKYRYRQLLMNYIFGKILLRKTKYEIMIYIDY